MKRDTEGLKLMFSSEQIREMNAVLADKISNDYAGVVSAENPLLVVVTLKGALFFAADLIRQIQLPCRVDFTRVASYGAGTKSSGTIQITKDIESPLEGRHVLILDEIIDSGRTLKFITERLAAGQAKSIKICALLSKPTRREVEVRVDYVGKEIPDRFVVGYGLDFNERYRELPDIFAVEND